MAAEFGLAELKGREDQIRRQLKAIKDFVPPTHGHLESPISLEEDIQHLVVELSGL